MGGRLKNVYKNTNWSVTVGFVDGYIPSVLYINFSFELGKIVPKIILPNLYHYKSVKISKESAKPGEPT